MKTYKNKKEGFREIQKKAIIITGPAVGFAVILVFVLRYINGGGNYAIPYLIIFMLAVVGIGIYRGLKRQRLLYESYSLTISEDEIQRVQLNTPTVKIRKDEIKSIQKGQNGSFMIRGENKTDLIIVTKHIDHYDAFENDLRQLDEIQFLTSPFFYEKLKIPGFLFLLALMAIVYLSTNKYLVLVSGTILTSGLSWSFYQVQKSKNIDRKTKRSGWWTILVILVIAIITYTKFVA